MSQRRSEAKSSPVGRGQRISRRRIIALLGSVALSRCTPDRADVVDPSDREPDRPPGRLVLPDVRAGGGRAGGASGIRRLRLGKLGSALLRIPAAYEPRSRAPLVVMLHGAVASAPGGLRPFLDLADQQGILLLAPNARGRTWDLLESGYGPDVLAIERALEIVLGTYSVERRRIALEGFSDGASYALSLGITNGDVFSHIIAFSPGFAAPAARRGSPVIYISHGVDDHILPIDATSRRLVPRLRRADLDVTYREFDGGHRVPKTVAAEALAWWLKG